MVDDLYQDLILDHSKRPRNCHAMDDATRNAEGYNPLCGDKLKLYVKMDGDIVKDVSFVGSGCAISTASASLMTESLKGKTSAEALTLLDTFHELLTTDFLPAAATACSQRQAVSIIASRSYFASQPSRVCALLLLAYTSTTSPGRRAPSL